MTERMLSIYRDRKTGMTVKDISAKYGISAPTVTLTVQKVEEQQYFHDHAWLADKVSLQTARMLASAGIQDEDTFHKYWKWCRGRIKGFGPKRIAEINEWLEEKVI